MTRANPGLELIAPEANRRFITARLGCRREFPTGLDSGQSVEIAGFRVHAVPAAHEALEARLVTSWSTTDENIDHFLDLIRG